MKVQKKLVELIQSQSRKMPGQTIVQSAPSVSPLNEQIADLLFEIQSDPDQSAAKAILKNAKALMVQKKTETPTFLGLIGKCSIPGCDVHTLTGSSGEILEHFDESQSVPSAFGKARQFLKNSESSIIGVMVHSDATFECICLDGTVRKPS